MRGTVEQRHADTLERVAGEDTELHGLLATGVDRGDVLLRNAATGDLVHELVALAGLDRLDRDLDLRELAGATGLLLVRVVDALDGLADRLAVRDLRLADVGLDLELTLHTVDQHLEVQLAHTRDDGLAGLFVGVDLEGRVLLGQPLNRGAQTLLVTLRLRLDRDADDRGREVHGLQDDRVLLVAQRLTGGGLLETHDGDDVAGAHRVDLFTLVRVHAVDLADALLAALHRVEDGGAGLKAPGVDPDEGELAQVRVGHDLERKRGERLVVRGLAGDLDRVVAGLGALDGLDVQRRRQVLDDRVEQGLDALVLERGATEDRRERRRQGALADRGDEQLLGDVLALHGEFHHLVADVRHGVQERLAVLRGLLLQVGRDVDDVVHLALGGLGGPDQRLHADKVDNALEVRLGTDRELHHQRGGAEALHDGVDAEEEVGARAVQLVDEADARDAVAVSLPPHGLGLGLDTGNTVEHRDGTVEDAKRTLHLYGEVDVTRGVDDVDGVVDIVDRPVTGRRGRRDRDAALLLLLHPVHGGSAIVDLTDLVRDTGVEQDPLGGGGLARVDVRHDPDVADPGKVKGGCSHGGSFSLCLVTGLGLPAVVREGLVGLGHLVGVLATLHGSAQAVAGVEDLVHQALGHGLLATGAGVTDHPAQRQGGGAARTDLDRNLVRGATDAAGLDLKSRLDVLQRALERDDGVGTGLLADALEGAVHDPLGGGALAVQEDLVDQRRHHRGAVNRVDDDRALRGGALTRH